MNWQPIETAPKDGTRVLIFDAERSPSEMIARFYRGDWWSDKTPSGRSIVWSDDATHWMPLPEPPRAEK